MTHDRLPQEHGSNDEGAWRMAHAEFLSGTTTDRVRLQKQAEQTKIKRLKRKLQSHAKPNHKRLKQSKISDFFKCSKPLTPSKTAKCILKTKTDSPAPVWDTPHIQGHLRHTRPSMPSIFLTTPENTAMEAAERQTPVCGCQRPKPAQTTQNLGVRFPPQNPISGVKPPQSQTALSIDEPTTFKPDITHTHTHTQNKKNIKKYICINE